VAWCLGFAGALIFYLGATTFSGFDWARHQRLVSEAAQAQATITSVEPNSHSFARYEFEVGGKRYQASATGVHDVRVGDHVTVFYLPTEPRFSTLRTPGSDLRSNIAASVAMAVVAGCVVAWRVGKAEPALAAPNV
jgi:hypothetical protein